MAKLPRGIAPELLLSQVNSTMPYLFTPESKDRFAEFIPAMILRQRFAEIQKMGEIAALTHVEYFQLCLCAHYASCGTPVPTDVDNQIRLKLWPKKLPLTDALEMAEWLMGSRRWDFTLVSSRNISGAAGTPWAQEVLSGHLGEWFTVATAAYAAMKQYPATEGKTMQLRLLAAISDEVNRHSEIFASLLLARDGTGCLKAASSIAHNMGDLDRVMDMWSLEVGDPLRLAHYKLSATPYDPDGNLRYQGRLWIAGELYKSKIKGSLGPSFPGSSLALENHRHFALRKPKSLRRKAGLVVPTAPFFDEWGVSVAQELGGNSEEILEIVEALKLGWDRQPGTIAYGRALRSILEELPYLAENLHFTNALAVPEQKFVLETSCSAFEKNWSEEALRLMDDIPSRA